MADSIDVDTTRDGAAAGRVEEEEDPHSRQVFDLNWSNDGSVLAAGIERQVIMLDMKQVLQTAPETLLELSEARLTDATAQARAVSGGLGGSALPVPPSRAKPDMKYQKNGAFDASTAAKK